MEKLFYVEGEDCYASFLHGGKPTADRHEHVQLMMLYAGAVPAARLPGVLKPGDYRAAFFDPFTGQQVGESAFRWTGTEETAVMPLPPFRIDIAFKILPAEVRR